MVSASSIESIPRFTEMLHQCETLKASICGKTLEVTSILMDEFVFRQDLENLYKSILLTDVQFALDNKIELELWNCAFKEHIDSFRSIIKERKNNNEKSEIQAKLFMFLDASIGFYFQLLQEFCDIYDLDLPYHGKARQLGMISKQKNALSERNPKFDSCLYICQDCLVHLGDLARYRNEMQQAHAFYMLAAKILPGNGQPYNQLAILASAKNDMLYAVFYYCKSISVPNQFPAAASNLQKTFVQASAKYSFNVLGKSCGLTVEEFFGLFINLSGCTYLAQDIAKLNVLRNKIMQDFNKILLELKTCQVILITGICIFNLQKSRNKKGMMESIVDDDVTVKNFMLSFCVSILKIFLENTIESLQMNLVEPDNLKCLPGIKMFTDWILCSTFDLLESEQFQGNNDLFLDFAVLGNELQRIFKKRDKSLYPLLEDRELHGLSVLQKVHRRYDFRIQSFDLTTEQINSIRSTRVLKFLDWLVKQKQTSTLITKNETDNPEYVCLLSPKQQGRCKSPFAEKSMSLFRTDSEECGMNEIPVQGPVASYSLFDSMWKSSLQQTPPSESVSLITSTSSLLKGVTIQEDVISSSISDMHEQNLIRTSNPPQPSTVSFDNLTARHSIPKTTSVAEKDIYSKTATSSTPPAPAMQLQTSLGPTSVSSHISEGPTNGILPINNDHHAHNSIGNGPLSALNHENKVLPTPYLKQALNMKNAVNHHHKQQQQQQQQQHQQRHQDILLAGNVFLPKQFESPNHVNDNHFHSPLLARPGFDPNQTASAQFTNFNSSNFGVIGQSIRAPPGMPRSPMMSSQFGQLPPSCPPNSILPHPSWVGNNQRLPNKMVVENRSIWSSNYAIGQGELSPLEQLLQEQRRQQRPK